MMFVRIFSEWPSLMLHAELHFTAVWHSNNPSIQNVLIYITDYAAMTREMTWLPRIAMFYDCL